MSERLANFTRSTVDLPAKFRREGRWHLIPLYHLLQLSDFGREGIARSGSYRFADHLYRGVPSGRGWLGRALDRILLNLPAARGMRARCARAVEEMQRCAEALVGDQPLRVLTVPCGIPRDVRTLSETGDAAKIEYTGLDLDPNVVVAAHEFLQGSSLADARLMVANALVEETWPAGEYDFICSTGLGEFLNDDELAAFYGNVYRHLAPGGVFFTSATACEPRADWLMRAFELQTNYRGCGDLARLLGAQPWASVQMSHDATGLQTFVRAVKGGTRRLERND